MSIVQASPFTFRDFLQSILPGLIAASLFAPYTGAKSTEEFLIGIALLSYVAYTPMSQAANIFKIIPFLRNKLKHLEEEKRWHSKNWDYTRLFYFASDEDREYLYLTAAYVQFYRITALYFLVYFLVQVGAIILAFNPLLVRVPLAHWKHTISETRTPLPGDWHAPTLLTAIGAAIILWFLIADFLNEYKILFQHQYVELARKYHTDKGGIALSIWGSVTEDPDGEKPIANFQVSLEDGKGNVIQEQKTDLRGRFQFSGLFKSSVERAYVVRAAQGAHEEVVSIPSDDKWAPPVSIVLPPPAIHHNSPAASSTNTSASSARV